MDVRRLELLRELAQRGTIAAVARATHRTPSAVSQQLKVLEREAGIPLTEPAGRGLRLTSAGRALAATAADVAVAIERAEATWREYVEQPAGDVTVTTFPSGGEMLLPGLVSRLSDAPHLRLVCSDHEPDEADFVDLALDHDLVIADAPMTAAWERRGLRVVPLMSEPLDIALPETHPLAEKTSLIAEDVIDEPWIGVPEDFPFDRILVEMQNATGRVARVVQRFSDNGVVEAFVAAGHGLAVLPRFTTRAHGNGLVTRPLLGLRSRREITALVKLERLERPSVRRVIDELRAEAREVALAAGVL